MKARLILIAIGILSLFACNNEDSVEPLNYEDSAYVVVGRWYTESNVNDPLFNMYAEYVFTADGAIYADEYRKINGYRRDSIQGKYSVKNGKITSEFSINQGGQSTLALKVTNGLTFAASFHRFSEDYTLTFNRVVGEITLTVDSVVNIEANLQQNIEAYTALPVEIKGYEMADEAIASVDESGLVTAKLIGVTFLKAETSAGTAVLKVSVSDKDNLWNDFSRVLGKDFSDVERLLGKHYAFKNDSVICYFYDSYCIDSVVIYRHKHIADLIDVQFKDSISEWTVNNYLCRNLYIVKDTISYRSYTNSANFLLATYSAKWDKNINKLSYTYFAPDWNDRICDYGITYEELKNKYGSANAYRENAYAHYNGKYDFITQISYSINNEGKVFRYSFYINPDIEHDQIIEFLNKNFFYINSNRPFVRNFQYKGKEMINYVSISNDNYRSLTYFFEENR